MWLKSMYKNSPGLVETIDRLLLASGPVTDQTTPLGVITFQGHWIALQFRLIQASQSLVILGLPWLTAQDPCVHLQKGTLCVCSQ